MTKKDLERQVSKKDVFRLLPKLNGWIELSLLDDVKKIRNLGNVPPMVVYITVVYCISAHIIAIVLQNGELILLVLKLTMVMTSPVYISR